MRKESKVFRTLEKQKKKNLTKVEHRNTITILNSSELEHHSSENIRLKDCKNGKHSEPEHDPESWIFELLSREKGVFLLWSKCSKWSGFWFPFHLRCSNSTLSPPMLESWHLLLQVSVLSLSFFLFFLFCLFVWSTSSSFSLPGIDHDISPPSSVS